MELGWFRKSPVQPVTAFTPVLDPAASPPVLETNDPVVGLMREFQISGPIWGRYEVWKQWDADPDPQRLAWRQRMQAQDISARVGATGNGNVWKLKSVGFVFRRIDPNVAFDQYPNQVLGTDILTPRTAATQQKQAVRGSVLLRQGQSTSHSDRIRRYSSLAKS